MRISDSLPNLPIIIERTRSEMLSSLLPGQQVTAKVLSATENGQVKLLINGDQLTARTELTLRLAETVQLKVMNRTLPIELQLMQPPATTHVTAATLRSALPRQQSLAPLLNQFTQLLADRLGGVPLSSPPPGSSPIAPPGQPAAATPPTPPRPAEVNLLALLLNRATPPTVHTGSELTTLLQSGKGVELNQAIQSLVTQLITHKGAVSAEQLKGAVDHSGLFLEAQLALGKAPVVDLKASLLQLLLLLRTQAPAAAAVPPQPGQPAEQPQQPATTPLTRLLAELTGQVEGSLAKVVVNQLASLPANDNNNQVWQFALPIRDQQTTFDFQFKLTREAPSREQEEDQPRWSVKLNFDMEPLGAVAVFLNLQGEQISSHFVAEQVESARRLGDALPRLSEAFARAGFSLGRMTATQGTDVNPERPLHTPYSLLDEQA